MNGQHILRIKTPLCSYKILLERNITVLTGDSGIGKTSIYRAIDKYNRTGGKCDISVTSDCNVVVMDRVFDEFSYIHNNVRNSIFVIDEGREWIKSDEFARLVSKSSNYFVIISRDPLYSLPYSVHSVITLKTRNGRDSFETISEKLFVRTTSGKDVDIVITEDSKSGRELYKRMLSTSVRDIKGEPEGKSTVYDKALDMTNSGVSSCVIVDGAAFGCEIRQMLKLVNSPNSRVTLWAPESFEWLILKSGVIRKHGVEEILNSPADYIESSDFMSWEQFFTWLLTELTKDTTHPYSKSKLHDWYFSPENLEKLKAVIPKELRDKICGT